MSFKPIALLAAAAIVTGTFAGALHAEAAQATKAVAHAEGARTIDVTASRYKFEPETITLHEGQPVTLRLTSKDVAHGIADADLGIPNTVILKGKTSSVTFTPKKLGTFKVHCSVFCGVGHAGMVLTVKVIK